MRKYIIGWAWEMDGTMERRSTVVEADGMVPAMVRVHSQYEKTAEPNGTFRLIYCRELEWYLGEGSGALDGTTAWLPMEVDGGEGRNREIERDDTTGSATYDDEAVVLALRDIADVIAMGHPDKEAAEDPDLNDCGACAAQSDVWDVVLTACAGLMAGESGNVEIEATPRELLHDVAGALWPTTLEWLRKQGIPYTTNANQKEASNAAGKIQNR